LANPNGTVEIYGNAPGGNSEEEVEAVCLTASNSIEDRTSTLDNGQNRELLNILLESITSVIKAVIKFIRIL
jgi:hypothetical protein